METPEEHIVVTNEKEKLDLIEKKVDIRKKILEIQKEKLDFEIRSNQKEKQQLEFEEKKASVKSLEMATRCTQLHMEETIWNRNLERARLLNDKFFSVLVALSADTIDTDRTLLASEPYYKPLIEGKNREIALKKLMMLIEKI